MLPTGGLDPDEALYAALIDDLIEKVWPQDGPIAWREPDEYRAIVERLDRIPPAMRATLGRKIGATLDEAIATDGRRSFLLYDTSQEARILFVCDVLGDRQPEDRLMVEITLLASVRQHQALESGADPNGVTLAIGILNAGERGRQYSFAFIGSPPPPVPDDLRAQIERDYGILRGGTIERVQVRGVKRRLGRLALSLQRELLLARRVAYLADGLEHVEQRVVVGAGFVIAPRWVLRTLEAAMPLASAICSWVMLSK